MAESESTRNPEVATGQVRIERLYLKDSSFESPQAPEIFGNRTTPEFQLEINTRTASLGPDRIEVVLGVTLRARVEEAKTAFIAEVQYAGIFLISGFDAPTTQRILGTFCPNTLFPYIRETVDSLVTRGGFPPVHLAPINFDALYAEALRKQQQQQAVPPPAVPPPVAH
jgi:preprotein translocase subunit SecB